MILTPNHAPKLAASSTQAVSLPARPAQAGRLVHGRTAGEGDAAAAFEGEVDFGEALFAAGEEHVAEQGKGGDEVPGCAGGKRVLACGGLERR